MPAEAIIYRFTRNQPRHPRAPEQRRLRSRLPQSRIYRLRAPPSLLDGHAAEVSQNWARTLPEFPLLPVLPPAILALADGTVFSGTSIGAAGHTVGEVVFNTALTGYQEILTDPSYC